VGIRSEAGVFTAIACGSSDAHLNPAVTIGFAMRDGNFAKFAPYLVRKCWGNGGRRGRLAALLSALEGDADTAAKLGCFCTAPAIRNAFTNLLSEVIATFALVF